MRALTVVFGGIIFLSVFVLFGWLWGTSMAGMAAKAFIPIWLLMAGINMWVGIRFAGYSARDEIPIFLVVFFVPTIVAGIAIWRVSML